MNAEPLMKTKRGLPRAQLEVIRHNFALVKRSKNVEAIAAKELMLTQLLVMLTMLTYCCLMEMIFLLTTLQLNS